MLVFLLRWLFGWTDFEVHDKYPERFLNMAHKNGLNMWDMKNADGIFSAKAKSSDIKYIRQIAEKSMCDIHIINEHGFLHTIKKYKHRFGLIAGFILWGIAIKYFTGFLWNINITVPPMLNEFEVRQELRELGFYEGARLDTIDTEIIKSKISVKDNRISWITINIMGTDAEVNISPNLALNLDNKQKISASNIFSNADGMITRFEIKSGYSDIKIGEGVHKGQLLVSGVKEYTDGSSALFDSNAQIYAKTFRTVTISIPKSFESLVKLPHTITKNDINIMGLTLPLTLYENPKGDYIKNTSSYQIDILGHGIPIYILSETWQKYKKQPVHLTDKQAETLLKNKLKLYEIFMLYSANKATILNKNLKFSQNRTDYILAAEYSIEEDIAQKSIIQIKDTSNSGT